MRTKYFTIEEYNKAKSEHFTIWRWKDGKMMVTCGNVWIVSVVNLTAFKPYEQITRDAARKLNPGAFRHA